MKKLYWVLGGVGIFFLLLLLLVVSTEDSNSTQTTNVNVGEEGRLYIKGSSVVPVCISKAYINELIDAAVANDEIGYRNLIMSPKCYVASALDDYGRVLVLDNDWGVTKFRFIHPDAVHYKETAWTNYEFVIPI